MICEEENQVNYYATDNVVFQLNVKALSCKARFAQFIFFGKQENQS